MGQNCCAILNNLHHRNKSFWWHIDSSKYDCNWEKKSVDPGCLVMSEYQNISCIDCWSGGFFLKCSIISRVVEGEKLLNQWMDCLLIYSWTKFMDYQLLMSKMSELCHFPHFLFAISSIVCLWRVFFFPDSHSHLQ